MGGILLLPLLLWCSFLLITSPAVKAKIKIPSSTQGRIFLAILAVLLMLGIGASRLFFSEETYFLIPFLLLGMASLLFYNFRIYGFIVSGFGFLSNAAVMLLNGFKMPLVAEIAEFSTSPIYAPITEKTFLPFLADCFLLKTSAYVLAFSLGDLLCAFGFLVVTAQLTFVFLKEIRNKEKGEKNGN